MNDIKGIIEDVEKSSLVSDKVIKSVIEIIGQEKWQDFNDEKSDICTTEGELIITLKRIPDLEEENAKLKSIAEFQQSSNMKRHFEIQDLEKKNAELKSELTKKADTNHSLVEQMADLENENAELKEKREQDCDSSWYEGFNCSEKERLKQLTKAKEIIKDLMSFSVQLCDCRHTVDFEKAREQAVQFLKEIEK